MTAPPLHFMFYEGSGKPMQETMAEYDRWISRVCDHLNKLIQVDVDAACTYREALAHVDDVDVRADLLGFLRDHERHVMETSTIVRDLGGTPIDAHRDLKGAILEGVTRLRSRGTLGALKAMRTNERLTNRAYDKAADLHMPPIALAIVAENLADERRHLATIEAHIERLTGPLDRETIAGDRERLEPPFYPPV